MGAQRIYVNAQKKTHVTRLTIQYFNYFSRASIYCLNVYYGAYAGIFTGHGRFFAHIFEISIISPQLQFCVVWLQINQYCNITALLFTRFKFFKQHQISQYSLCFINSSLTYLPKRQNGLRCSSVYIQPPPRFKIFTIGLTLQCIGKQFAKHFFFNLCQHADNKF